MELIEFIEKFAPNSRVKFGKLMQEPNCRLQYEQMAEIYRKYFPEALQNFADRICEAQRENCADNYFRQDCENSLYDEVLSGEGNE
ncbi:MAG: hypothetical protein LBS50_09300, partial [Prevotellaceae bacterium]|nr:hypothetical protein [Prevotellaceae bacterium]